MTMIHRAKREGLGRLLAERDRLWLICSALFLGSAFLVFVRALSIAELLAPILWAGAQVARVMFPPLRDWHNLLVDSSSNYTTTLEGALYDNATSSSSCYQVTTNYTILEGLPSAVDGRYSFKTDWVYHITLTAYDRDGNKRCSGGDYYEVDLHDRDNVHFRSRPPTTDFGNGSYSLELMVPSRFAGNYTIEIWLLFSNWHGMDFQTDAWGRLELMVAEEFEFVVEPWRQQPFRWSMLDAADDLKARRSGSHRMKQCTPADFDRTTWRGRWTRSWYSTSCKPDSEMRFRCLDDEHYWCEEPWCFGPVGRLESNGWVYSAHCGLKIFQREEAWECLNGRWFFVWGDSNFQDTIRNLLIFILDWEVPRGKTLADFQLERTYESAFINPHRLDQLFRVSQLYNGANYEFDNGEGLNTLKHEEHQEAILAHFNNTRWPDTVLMNSGLHDGEQFENIENYVESASFAIDWWTQLYNRLPSDRRPQVVWRTTVAPAGASRKMMSNPNKMEMYNQVILEKLRQVGDNFPVKFVDGFDLTFPFHYNNDFSDGGHYGRAPGVNLPPWYKGPHWYFVDIMLAHIVLNAVCPMT